MMDANKLKEARRLHECWLKGEDGGQRADLQRADLQGAYLQGADLQGADLRGADLQRAYLQGADLQRAYLQGADLRGAKGFNPYRCTPLLMLRDQPGPIIAYKLVGLNGEGPYQGGICYTGEKDTFEVDNADTSPENDCGAGINVADLTWCMREWNEGYRILKVEFTAKDIAAIPHCTDGKFRVRKCKRVGEVDLKAIGLITDREEDKADAK